MIHCKHRQRMKEKLLADGEFASHELLELLLSFAIPRKNTNEIAHRLIDRFGSLESVFNAPCEEVAAVRGMGLHSALMLRTVAATWRRVREENDSKKTFDTMDKLTEYGTALFEGMTCESVYVLLLDSQLRMVDTVCLADGSGSDAEVRLGGIAACPVSERCVAAVVYHNHPDGNPNVSEADRDFAARTAELFAMQGIEVIEHIVVTGKKFLMLVGESKENQPESVTE